MADPLHRPSSAATCAERFAGTRTGLIIVITIVLAGWALRAIGSIAVPLVFAIFLTLLIAPIDRWVSERVPQKLYWLGHVAAMTVILLGVVLFVGSLWLAAQQVISRFPTGSGDLATLIPDLAGQTGSQGQTSGASLVPGAEADRYSAVETETITGQGSGLSSVLGVLRGAAGSLADEVSSWITDLATAVLSMAGGLLTALVLVFFLTLLMLVEAPRWESKLYTLFNRSARDGVFDATAVIAQRLRRFLLVRLVLGLITAALYVGWLWLFGTDLLLVWGLLAVLLNFIPTIGSLIAGILPVIYAYMTKDFGTAILVAAGILVIEQVMGNFVDPRVQGKTVSLSSLVILVALLLWGWVWGIAGAFLAVPITIAFLVIGTHVPALRPFALLISDETTLEGLERSASR